MSCSKPLPPFVCDSLYYLNRDQLERFSIVCRPLKNFIDRYLHSKPYRLFDRLWIRRGSYALFHNDVQWHPNRDNYSVQQFLATQKCSIERTWNDYSFIEMRPYLGPSVRMMELVILVSVDSAYNPEHIDEMESISYLWRDGNIVIKHVNDPTRIDAEDFLLVLNSPTILQCQTLYMRNAHFSFKDYEILYAVKVIKIFHNNEDDIDLWHQNWQQFFEHPRVKPIIFFCFLRNKASSYAANVENLLDRLSKDFSIAVSPNAFKILFIQRNDKPLTEFRDMNYTSREKLVLKRGLPVEYQDEYQDKRFIEYHTYTLERSSI